MPYFHIMALEVMKMNLKQLNIGFCMCGSFCTFNNALNQVRTLVNSGASVYPILSENVQLTDTRFGKAEAFYNQLCEITGNEPIVSIAQAEPIGPQNKLDIMVVAPCTSNTMAKLANGITDNTVTMACKAHLRNNKPLVLAIATNDALGVSLQNIGALIIRKNMYFVPFGQDDYVKKPLSMIADFERLAETLELALVGKQIQPVIVK